MAKIFPKASEKAEILMQPEILQEAFDLGKELAQKY
jgi:hypothetical protein